ncbi:MAG TPA: PAS domain S-box protein [Polyangiaceae bacterium]|nr:PAS domain S-box protein [Polyangiaceae bacterium]
MAEPETNDELLRELLQLRARVQELSANAASAERDAARYRLLLDHVNVGVFVSSLEGRMLECNDRTVQMSGEDRESLLSKDLVTHYENPGDRARLVAELRATGRVRNFETWTRHRDGKRFASSMNAVLAPIGPDGAPLILGMLEDITERKLAEERAGEGEERFRVIAEQSMLGIIIFQDDTIRFVNQAVADINGYSVEEMSNWDMRDMAKVIHPDDVGFVIEQGRKKQAADPSALTHYSYRVIAKSGETRWVEQYSRGIEYGRRTASFVTMIDVTARKLAEASLSQLSLSMERTAKLESLGVLAAGIAHDFNNLLGGLFGHLDLARAQLDPRSAARSHLDLAHEAFERAKALTGQLLAFAKGGVPVRKVGSLATCVRQCAEFALSGSNVIAELDLDPDLWHAEFDSSQVSQAFDNLLINAKQAMPSGGTLQILGRNVDAEQGPGPELAQGRYVKLSFADRGPGIPGAILTRIFDPFFTTKALGSGIGLTAAYAILRKHDGHIEAESQPGAGATFHVWLPATVDQACQLQPKTQHSPGGRGLVLVMDDDDIVRHVAGGILKHLGYEAILTCDGLEALERTQALLAEGKQLRAAMLDLTVRAGQGGRDTVRPLSKLVPGLPIIASSGYSDDPVMADPAQFGFSASLPKPFRMNELGDLLARLAPTSR